MGPDVNVKQTDDGQKTDVYVGPEDGNHSHDVISNAADGWTTHDYGRDDQGNTSVDYPLHQGEVISGSDQYDEGWDEQPK